MKHLLISTVRGEFGKTEGTVVIDEADVTRSSVEATIDAATINTRDEKRDGHLKAPDFFDVAKFPTITFKSTKVEKAGEGPAQGDRRPDHARRHQAGGARRRPARPPR